MFPRSTECCGNLYFPKAYATPVLTQHLAERKVGVMANQEKSEDQLGIPAGLEIVFLSHTEVNISHSQTLQHENTYRGRKIRRKVKMHAAA